MAPRLKKQPFHRQCSAKSPSISSAPAQHESLYITVKGENWQIWQGFCIEIPWDSPDPKSAYQSWSNDGSSIPTVESSTAPPRTAQPANLRFLGPSSPSCTTPLWQPSAVSPVVLPAQLPPEKGGRTTSIPGVCVYVCMCVCVYVYIYMYVYVYVCIYIWYVNVYIYTHTSWYPLTDGKLPLRPSNMAPPKGPHLSSWAQVPPASLVSNG